MVKKSKKYIQSNIDTSENLIRSFNACISLNNSSKIEFFQNIRDLKQNNITISQFKHRYPNLFDGSLNNYFGKYLKPNTPNYDKKLKQSLFGGIKRCYNFGVKSQFKNFSQFAKTLELAFKDEAPKSTQTFLKVSRTNISNKIKYSYRKYFGYKRIIDNWILVRKQIIFDYQNILIDCYSNICLNNYNHLTQGLVKKYCFKLSDFKQSRIRIVLVVDITDLFGNALEFNKIITIFRHANLIEIKNMKQIIKRLNTNFENQINELDKFFTKALNSIHYMIKKSTIYIDFYT